MKDLALSPIGDRRPVRVTPPATARPEPDAAPRLRLRDYFTLRPYGRSLITPAVSVWLLSAWIVILLMATIEGFVWGAVGASLVPSASPWLAPPVAVFMFLLMFSIIWIVDSSLIMSERPSLAPRRRSASDPRGIGPMARWILGLAVRVAIVAISLYVTAPFIEKLIRADDIAAWHQARVEQYFKQRDATLQAQVEARAKQTDAGLAARIASLEQEIDGLNKSLATEQDRRDRIEAEYKPQLEVLTKDLAAARQRVGDEVLGRDGRPEGYGPQARKWDARAALIEQDLKAVQDEREARLADILSSIDSLRQRIGQRSDTLEQVRIEQAELLQKVRDQVLAEQPPASPPKLTFAARSKGLSALRNSPDEAGVPHFETVEGFAQAALGVLFFALIALKLFEPAAVHAYYSETIQSEYAKYLAGGLDGVPGFEQQDDPRHRLTPVEFYRRWERYERDPDAYFEQMRAMTSAESRFKRLLADHAYELELLQRQRQEIDHRLELERRRREADLAAHERELDMQLEEQRKRMAGETRAEIDRVEAKRAELRRTHELEVKALNERFTAEQERLDAFLARERAQWEQERALAEEQLRQKREAFEDSRRQARDQERRRRVAQDDWRRLQEMELQQKAVDSERGHARAARQMRIDETREVLAGEREIQARQREELARLRGELSRAEGQLVEQTTEHERLLERLAADAQRMESLQQRIDEATRSLAQDPDRQHRFRGNPALRRQRDAQRRLERLEAERDTLRQRERDLRASVVRLQSERDGLAEAVATREAEAIEVDRRIASCRQQLDRMLLDRG